MMNSLFILVAVVLLNQKNELHGYTERLIQKFLNSSANDTRVLDEL